MSSIILEPLPTPISLPTIKSALIAVRQSAAGGRGVFANEDIPAGTLVYTTKPTPASVIYRIFRKEVCSWCFAYDSGRTWKITSDHPKKVLGPLAYFCSDRCKTDWEDDLGNVGREAWSCVETWMKKAGKKPDELAEPKPNEAEINSAWKEAESVGMQILESRSTTAPTKNHRRALANALSLPPFPDTMALLLSGILTAYSRPEMFNLMLHLELVSQPYRSPIHFQSHLSSYKTMLALLPRALLPFVTPRNFRAIASRDVHNSFGIWSHPGDSTAEMLGFGIWPDASFFNHSCAPNMGTKDRLGRAWEFRSSKQIQKDEELFISYLSLEELEEMDAFARRERLQNVWGFECSCHRCRIEIEGNES